MWPGSALNPHARLQCAVAAARTGTWRPRAQAHACRRRELKKGLAASGLAPGAASLSTPLPGTLADRLANFKQNYGQNNRRPGGSSHLRDGGTALRPDGARVLSQGREPLDRGTTRSFQPRPGATAFALSGLAGALWRGWSRGLRPWLSTPAPPGHIPRAERQHLHHVVALRARVKTTTTGRTRGREEGKR